MFSVNEAVYRQLRHEVMAGQFERGKKLSIRTLASRYHTSFTPVREAIKRLVAEGGLEVQANRTFRIPKLSQNQQREILELRCSLEGSAVEAAATHMTATTFRKLETIERKRKRLASKGDNAGLRELNRQFHFTLYQRSNNKTLMQLIENLWLRYASSYQLVSLGEDQLLDFPHHDQLMQALDAGNPRAARKALEADLTSHAVSINRRGKT